MGFRWIRGKLAVVGYQPDGDSVLFIPDDLVTVRGLENGDRVDPSKKDGSIQLRLDGIDAPETHYEDQAQPLATPARDTLVAAVGLSDVRYGDDGTVTASTPDTVPATICASLVEVNGRPVSLLPPGTPRARTRTATRWTRPPASTRRSTPCRRTTGAPT